MKNIFGEEYKVSFKDSVDFDFVLDMLSLDDFIEFCRNADVDFDIDNQLYSDLFYGTNSHIYIPLWASVAKTDEDVLMNHVTLDVIKYYKAFGYEHINMDGNPADFIGEQFRFLEYLTACAINGTMDTDKATDAIEEFEKAFLIDTIKLVLKGINEYDADNHLQFIVDLLEAVNSRNYYPWQFEPTELNQWQKQPPLEVEEPHIVSVASSCD